MFSGIVVGMQGTSRVMKRIIIAMVIIYRQPLKLTKKKSYVWKNPWKLEQLAIG